VRNLRAEKVEHNSSTPVKPVQSVLTGTKRLEAVVTVCEHISTNYICVRATHMFDSQSYIFQVGQMKEG